MEQDNSAISKNSINHPKSDESIHYFHWPEGDADGYKIASGIQISKTIEQKYRFKEFSDFEFWLRVRPDGPCIDLIGSLVP